MKQKDLSISAHPMKVLEKWFHQNQSGNSFLGHSINVKLGFWRINRKGVLTFFNFGDEDQTLDLENPSVSKPIQSSHIRHKLAGSNYHILGTLYKDIAPFGKSIFLNKFIFKFGKDERKKRQSPKVDGLEFSNNSYATGRSEWSVWEEIILERAVYVAAKELTLTYWHIIILNDVYKNQRNTFWKYCLFVYLRKSGQLDCRLKAAVHKELQFINVFFLRRTNKSF